MYIYAAASEREFHRGFICVVTQHRAPGAYSLNFRGAYNFQIISLNINTALAASGGEWIFKDVEMNYHYQI